MTKNQQIVETMPWHNTCKLIQDFSYAGVAVFLADFPIADGHLLFAPIDQQEGMEYCLTRAWLIGKKKVATREWLGFNIHIAYGEAISGQTIDWPHVNLVPYIKNNSNLVKDKLLKEQPWRCAAGYKI